MLAGAPAGQPTAVDSWIKPELCSSDSYFPQRDGISEVNLRQKFITWVGYRVWEVGIKNAAFVLEFVEKLVTQAGRDF